MLITAKEASELVSVDILERECELVSDSIRLAAKNHHTSLNMLFPNKNRAEFVKAKFESLGFKVFKIKVHSNGRDGDDFEIKISWE